MCRSPTAALYKYWIMKYLFLLVGLVCGAFGAQIYNDINIAYTSGAESRLHGLQLTDKSVKPKIKSIEKPVIEEVESKASNQNKQLIIFTTSWCPYCKKAKSYFIQHHISFIEYDIEKDERARRMHDLLGGGGIPIIIYNGKMLRGFSQNMFLAMYR